MANHLPRNYQEWRHCITVICGIPLTPNYISQRLTVWRNDELEETKRFRQHYGDSHLQAVIGWFEQAEREVNKNS